MVNCHGGLSWLKSWWAVMVNCHGRLSWLTVMVGSHG